MQALRIGWGLALLLMVGLVLLASGPSQAQDTGEAAGTADTAASDTGDDAARNSRCLGTLGPDFVRAFNQDANDEPLNASNLDLPQTPRAEPIDVPC